jgi:ribosomal protein S18 acetylase RimI-like enzyme
MEPWKIEHADKPSPDDMRYVIGQLKSYNDIHTPTAFERQDIRLFVRDADGQIVAGLLGAVNMHCLAIQIMWVDERQRGGGMGTALLAKAEGIAIAAGAVQAVVETTSFQAPRFYEKQGFTILFELEDAPIGSKTIFLRKRLG